MSRRLTVPTGYVGLVLPAQLADELTSLMREQRRQNKRGFDTCERWNAAGLAPQSGNQPGDPVEPKPIDEESHARYKVAGDIMLALLEAQEA
jgi:hypothetical protein